MATMANQDPRSSPTLRFLGIINHPHSADPLELHENDVVWSFSVSSSPNSCCCSPSHSVHHQPQLHSFSPYKAGLSSALLDDDDSPVQHKSSVNPNVIPHVARQEEKQQQNRSAPVNIPPWSKEFRGEYSDGDLTEDDYEESEVFGEGGMMPDEEMIPPHVLVARSHVTSSVFEGRGRTLKGRDLRRVRNAVFQETGFVD